MITTLIVAAVLGQAPAALDLLVASDKALSPSGYNLEVNYRIRNVTLKDMDYVKVTITFYDQAGRIMTSQQDAILNLTALEIKGGKFMFPGTQVAGFDHYNYDFEGPGSKALRWAKSN